MLSLLSILVGGAILGIAIIIAVVFFIQTSNHPTGEYPGKPKK